MKNVSRLIPLLSGIVTLSGCNHAPQKNNGQNSQKPNIIYIFADDLGIGDLSCYGATKVSTPNIDRLAGQGVQFTNAYATSATSTPSRFGLLTGMYPWRQENTGIAPALQQGSTVIINNPDGTQTVSTPNTRTQCQHDATFFANPDYEAVINQQQAEINARNAAAQQPQE